MHFRAGFAAFVLCLQANCFVDLPLGVGGVGAGSLNSQMNSCFSSVAGHTSSAQNFMYNGLTSPFWIRVTGANVTYERGADVTGASRRVASTVRVNA